VYVLLRYTDYDCPFGIFKLLFLFKWRKVYISLPKDIHLDVNIALHDAAISVSFSASFLGKI
jgi:hypothetical protein